MRTKNFTRNFKYSILLEVLILAIGLILPRLIIETYGSSVNGLKASITQVLRILNLLQAGSLGASIFSLYEPLAHNNFHEVSRILSVSRRVFHRMGIIFLLGTFIIAPFAALFIIDAEIKTWAIIVSFFVLGINTALSYFFISKYDIILSADQKRYILSISGVIQQVVYFLAIVLVIKMKMHFVIMYSAIIVATLAKVLYLEFVYRKLYKDKIKTIYVNKTEKIRNRHYVMLMQIAMQSVAASPILILSFTYNLKIVSVYSIYNLVQNMIIMVFNSIYHSVGEILGNLVAIGDKKKINEVFNLLNFFYMILGTWMIASTLILIDSFVGIYTANINDVDYLVTNLDIMISIHLFSYIIYMTSKNAVNSFGLFKESYKFSVLAAIISIIIAVLGARESMIYVLTGPSLYYFLMSFYLVILLKKTQPWLDFKKSIFRTVPMIIIILIASISNKVLQLNMSNWGEWLLYAIFTAVSLIVIMFGYVLIFEKKELNKAINRFKSII